MQSLSLSHAMLQNPPGNRHRGQQCDSNAIVRARCADDPVDIPLIVTTACGHEQRT